MSMQFKIHVVKDSSLMMSDSGELKMSEMSEKDVIVEAESCCEACVRAKHLFPEFEVMKWEVLKK